jgi:hypothetical protein
MNKPPQVLLLLLFFLVSCTSQDTGIDSELLSKNSCAEPCWQNLTPGISDQDDVDKFINSLNAKEWPGRKFHTYDSGCTWIRLTDAKISENAKAVVDLSIEASKLTFVQSDHINLPKLEQVINHFGDPEYFKAVLGIGPDGEIYVLEIYYPSKGIAFTMATDKDDVGYIKPDMQIDSVQYFVPSDLETYLTSRYSCSVGQQGALRLAESEISKYIQPWNGYGKVNVIPSK